MTIFIYSQIQKNPLVKVESLCITFSSFIKRCGKFYFLVLLYLWIEANPYILIILHISQTLDEYRMCSWRHHYLHLHIVKLKHMFANLIRFATSSSYRLPSTQAQAGTLPTAVYRMSAYYCCRYKYMYHAPLLHS